MYIDLFGSLPLVVIWLALGAVGIVIQAFVRGQSKLVFGYYNATLIMTGVLAAVTHSHEGTSFNGMITLGGMASYFDMLFCGAGVLTMWGARGRKCSARAARDRRTRSHRGESGNSD